MSIGVGIFFSIVPLVVFQFADTSDFCTKPGCRKASSDVLSFIDPSTDPCQDFYKFTCGGIFKKTFENKPVSLEAIVTKDLEDQINLMLSKTSDESEPKAIRGLKHFFKSCLDEDQIEKSGMEPIKKVLEEMGGWPVLVGPNWDEENAKLTFDELLIKLRKQGMNFMQLFYFGVSVDRSLLMSEPVIKNIEDKDKESYHDFMVDVAVLLGADRPRASTELQETLLFKMKLLRVLENAGMSNKTTIGSVQTDFPYLNWSSFINKMFLPPKELTDEDEIYFPSREYLKDLEQLLKDVSNRTLANYILWEAIEAAEPYLPKEFKNVRLHHTQSSLGKEEPEKEKSGSERFDFCKNEAREILPPTFEALYVREYFSPEKRRKVKEIVDAVRFEFLNLLNDSEIFDEASRRKALEKVEGITYHVGAPEEIFEPELLEEIFQDEEEADFEGGKEYLGIASILNRQRMNFKLKLGSILNDYYEQTVRVNAFYDSLHNTMVLPAAILQGLFFNENRPQYMNFGTIGTLIGHEITHGFTEDGSNYDKNGNYDQMWTNATKKNFEKKALCFVLEAANFKIEESTLRMDGRRTLEENTCDYTGAQVAYRAYKSWTNTHGEEKQLPGLTYNAEQLFWIMAGSYFCDTVSLDELKEFVNEEQHSHPTFRTYSAFSNNEHFGRDFDCQVGKRMNPFRKCHIF